jgi:hypothetical protein
MDEIINVIYEKIKVSLALQKEIEDIVKPIKQDPNFHKIAAEIIPNHFRTGPHGYQFLLYLLGEKKAKELHIHDPEIDSMRNGGGI